MKQKINLSIVTVTRNNLKELEKTYTSLISQNASPELMDNFEWIVVDGDSSDGTTVFLEEIKFDGGFSYISEPDIGIFDAMNKGMRMASGRHILYLNAGDVLATTDILSLLIKLSRANPDRIIAGQVNMRWSDYSCISDLAPWVCHQAVMTPIEILSKFQFDSSKKFYGDLHLWMRLAHNNLFNVVRVGTVICNFDLGGVGNNPENLWNRLKEREQLSVDFRQHSRYFYRLIYTLALFFVWKLLGRTYYYRMIWLMSRLK